VPSLLVALAVALRLAWVLLVPTRPVGDFALYIESAAHLLEHHALDAEFIYMPGYVLLLAGVQALGGGLLAAKLVGVAAGGLGAWAVFAIGERLFDRRAAIVATLLYACWPAGIAVASVTGTDMPAAALLALAASILARADPARPWRAPIAFGLVLGLAAYVRAVALPLALLAFPYWWAEAATAGPKARARLKIAAARTAVGCAIAFLVLLPWGIRNQLRYGEFFLTDSHGGHTALVGANPNSEGVYSRSLNQMFWKGTGFRLFDPSPRDSDRAAYALAKSWAAFEPAYAAGLIVAKADRLLTTERNLLYWPLYRESVLRDPPRGFFQRHRAGLETMVDGFWWVLAAAALAGLVVAVAMRRNLRALAIALFPLALVALYATFFSEVRYHLAIAIFMFPFAGFVARWIADGARDLAARRANAAARLAKESLAAALAVAVLSIGWPRLVQAGAALRDRHRWAVCVCHVAGASRLCNWRATAAAAPSSSPSSSLSSPAASPGPSPVRGVWDGVGLRVTGVTPAAAAASDVVLAPGRYRIQARVDRTPAPVAARPGVSDAPDLRVQLRADGKTVAGASLAPGAPAATLDGAVDHFGSSLHVELWVEQPSAATDFRSAAGASAAARTTVWLADIHIEPDLR
jgi:4-amino-4-deoxy-L-arabinose transferase-like glycosyltransferase